MRHVKFSLLILVCLSLASWTAFAADQPGISSDTTPGGTGDQGVTTMETKEVGCNLITFEGLVDNAPIGLVPGPVNVTFGASWLSLIDGDDGGSGNFANEPSSFTTAYFLDLADISITLGTPVQFVEFFYTASAISLPITVTAFDSGGNFVDQAVGNTVGTDFDGAACGGDPNGQFCLWDVITLTAAADNITSIQITGTVANQFSIDNLQFCTEEQELVSCCLDDLSCAQLTVEGCAAAGGVVVPNCENVDCAAVPNNQSTWGSLKGSYR
jgi:hypothetical protein